MHLARRGHDAVEPGLPRHPGQVGDLILHGARDSEGLEVLLRQAREHGDAEDPRAWVAVDLAVRIHFVDHTPRHEEAAGKMNREHADAEPRRLDRGARRGVRDVVQLEIEEDLAAPVEDLAHQGRAAGGEELQADLETARLGPQC